jgi:signal transduction histidine kinase
VEHETGRHIAELRRLAKRLRQHARRTGDAKLGELANDLRGWTSTVQSTRQLFAPFMDQESREKVRRLDARSVIERTIAQSSLLLRGVKVDVEQVPKGLRLPAGRFAEWVAIFQNLLVNAANATLDRSDRRIAVSGYRAGRNAALLVQDTGSGIDLDEAEELFAPFVRRQTISEERRALGAGGTGLGLTIVRMIARNTLSAAWLTIQQLQTWRSEALAGQNYDLDDDAVTGAEHCLAAIDAAGPIVNRLTSDDTEAS